MHDYDSVGICINEYSKRAFNSRRKKIRREGGTCFYDFAEELVKKIIDLMYISTEVPGNCDITCIELSSSNSDNLAFSFYMRNGEYHNSLETLAKHKNIYEFAKKISDTKYNSLVLFEAMKIWDKLDNFYVSNWESTVFDNGAESVKFSMMQ